MEVRRTPVLVLLMITVGLTTAQEPLKICVNETVNQQFCQAMIADTKLDVECVTGKTKMDCIRLVRDEKADIVQLEPPEIYTAGSFFDLELAATNLIYAEKVPYRYKTVVIIRDGNGITKLEDLKGKKSCFSSVGMAEGWTIPVGILLNKLNDIECKNGNELSSVGSFFESSCAPGNWSMDVQVNQVLKKENEKLCSLCEKPKSCDFTDFYAGAIGSLNCISNKHGDVAFTTLEHMKEFKKLNETHHRFLCLNGSTVPITVDNPCIWVEMPTAGYLIKKRRGDVVSSKVEELVNKVNELTQSEQAPWMKEFFGNYVELEKIIPERREWQNYLGNYVNVFNRSLSCEKKVRFCTVSDDEMKKCETFKMAAYSRYLRPVLECVKKDSSKECIAEIKEGNADLITLSGRDVYTAGKYEDMLPIASEQYPKDNDGSYYAVAVVKADSNMQTLADLKGKKSCHTAIGRNAGWIIPVSMLMQSGLSDKKKCEAVDAVAEFFSESCVPGVNNTEYNPELTNIDKLCKLCIGDESGANVCSPTKDRYSGYTGAFRCLVEGGGDVAFVKHTTVPSLTDGKSDLPWAKDLKSSDYKLLCTNGTSVITDHVKCNLGHVPSTRFVVTSNKMDHNDRVNVVYMLTTAGRLFNDNSSIFQLFGPYEEKSDLLFKDLTVSLKSVTFDSKYDQVLNEDYLESLKLTDPRDCNGATNAVAYKWVTFY